MGLLSVNQFNVAYATGTSTPTSIPWSGTLNAGDSVEVAFPANILPIGHYHLCVNTDLANDVYRGNDTLCNTIYGYVGGLEEIAEDKIQLFQNVPNPAKGYTTIEFYLPKPIEYHFVVTNILGEIVLDELVNASAGKQYKVLDINSLNEGVYFYTLVVDYHRLSRKMLIVK